MTTDSKPRFTSGPTVINNLQDIAPVAPGHTYEFKFDMSTRAGHTHKRGSLLHVEDRTTQTPHGEISESGSNWVCRTVYGTSVWASLEQCLSRGAFNRVRDYTVYFWDGDLGPEPKDNRGRPLVHNAVTGFTAEDLESLTRLYDVMLTTVNNHPTVLYLSRIGRKFSQR